MGKVVGHTKSGKPIYEHSLQGNEIISRQKHEDWHNAFNNPEGRLLLAQHKKEKDEHDKKVASNLERMQKPINEAWANHDYAKYMEEFKKIQPKYIKYIDQSVKEYNDMIDRHLKEKQDMYTKHMKKAVEDELEKRDRVRD
jgi:hypothetical protein